jgi:PAS domain S-box-containing protein
MSALYEFIVLIVRPISRFLSNTAGVVAWVLLWAMLPPLPARALQSDSSLPSPKRILLLHQASDPGALRGKFNIAFDAAIRSANPNPVEIYEEAIDLQRFHGANQSRLVREYLKLKYAGRNLDVIVTQGMGPLAFARENRALFGNPPIVATLSPAGQIDANDHITGLQGGFWIKGTLDLAMALRPETRNVVVVDGAHDNTSELQTDIERQVHERGDGLALVYLRDLPLAEVVARVEDAPPRSIVLFVRQSILNDEEDVDQLEALDRIAKVSRAPIFSQLEQYLGHGIIGGSMWRFEDDARRLATMASRIASGARVDDVPPGRNTYDLLIDWRQLRRWQIAESRVPVGTVVLFRQPSFLAQNGKYAAGALLLVLAQFALIVALLVQRFRRRAAEEESRQSKERYRSVVDTQSELICRFLPDTTLTFVNDAYCRFRNATRGELIGTKLITQIPESARETVLQRLNQLNGLDSYEHPVILPDGSVGWHFWANQAIRDDRGRIVEFQGIGRDITEQKRAQEALGQAEARNSAMLRAIPDLMFVMLRDGTYVDYHARDPKLLLAPPSVFIGKKVRDIMPPRLADVMMDAIEGACQREETVAVEYDLPLDEVRYFEARVVHAGDDRVLSMVRDVTDSKRAIALNRDLTGRLIASQEIERQRIARELHDDVSQKVALLNIDIEEVARQVEGFEPRARLQQLSGRTKEIASDLRDLSHELHASRLQSLGLMAAVEMLCRDTSKHLGVTVPFVHGTLPSEVDPNVSLCVYRIAQEALNNVTRHSHARHAQVMLFYESPMLMLQIADSGVGFDPRTTRHGGLGLISMRDRVAFLRGQLAIHTEPGGGTRIGVNIPIGLPAEASPAGISRSA